MSESGHSRRFAVPSAMSAMPPIADLIADILDGSEGPGANRKLALANIGLGYARLSRVVSGVEGELVLRGKSLSTDFGLTAAIIERDRANWAQIYR